MSRFLLFVLVTCGASCATGRDSGARSAQLSLVAQRYTAGRVAADTASTTWNGAVNSDSILVLLTPASAGRGMADSIVVQARIGPLRLVDVAGDSLPDARYADSTGTWITLSPGTFIRAPAAGGNVVGIVLASRVITWLRERHDPAMPVISRIRVQARLGASIVESNSLRFVIPM